MTRTCSIWDMHYSLMTITILFSNFFEKITNHLPLGKFLISFALERDIVVLSTAIIKYTILRSMLYINFVDKLSIMGP